ncbi:unnamed protein product, partial [Rotaria sp. Silwood1]
HATVPTPSIPNGIGID